MLLEFRVYELASLLGFAGKSKNGLKSDLVSRALLLLKPTQCTKSVRISFLSLQAYFGLNFDHSKNIYLIKNHAGFMIIMVFIVKIFFMF